MWHAARKQEKCIRSMMVDYKKRAERRRDYYEKIKQDVVKFLRLHGRQTKINFDNSEALSSKDHMMSWIGDSSVSIDRFDARANLEYYSEFKADKDGDVELSKQEQLEDRVCNYERYRCLVQNDFAGVNEEQFLRQIEIEEKFGLDDDARKKEEEEKKKKLQDSRTAIGFVYEDSTGPSPSKSSVKPDDTASDSASEADSDMDLDIEIDVNELTQDNEKELSKLSLVYGMRKGDFVKLLVADKNAEEEVRALKLIEEEKAQFSGKKSRRERRMFKEMRLKERNALNPPKFIGSSLGDPLAKYNTDERLRLLSSSSSDSSDSSPERGRRKRKSRSGDERITSKIEFITTFGDSDAVDSRAKRTSPKPIKCKPEKVAEPIIGPTLPPSGYLPPNNGSGDSSSRGKVNVSPIESRNQNISIDKFRERTGDHATRNYRNSTRDMKTDRSKSRDRRDKRSRSRSRDRRNRSRSRDRRDRSRSRNRRSRSRSRDRRNRSRSRDRRDRSRSRNRRSRSRSRGRRNRSRSRDRYQSTGKTGSVSNRDRDRTKRSGGRSKSPSTKSSTNESGVVNKDSKLNAKSSSPESHVTNTAPTIIRRYYRPELEKEYDSDDSNDNNESNKTPAHRVSRNESISLNSSATSISAKTSASAAKLTPQEILQKKMQLALNKAHKADKIAEKEKQYKLEQERIDRERELRQMAQELRKREAERRRKEAIETGRLLTDDEDDASRSRSGSRSRSRSRDSFRRARGHRRRSRSTSRSSERKSRSRSPKSRRYRNVSPRRS